MAIIWRNVLISSVPSKRIPFPQYVSLQIYIRHWKGGFTSAVSQLPLSCRGMRLGPGTLSYQERKSPNSCAGFINLGGNVSQVMRHLALPTVKSVPWGNRREFSIAALKAECLDWIPCMGLPLPRDPLAMGIPCPLLKQILLCLFPLWLKYCQYQDSVGRRVWNPSWLVTRAWYSARH